MQLYQFEVLRGEDVIAVEPSVPLYNTRAAWPKIIKMAKNIKLPGCRIRVREHLAKRSFSSALPPRCVTPTSILGLEGLRPPNCLWSRSRHC